MALVHFFIEAVRLAPRYAHCLWQRHVSTLHTCTEHYHNKEAMLCCVLPCWAQPAGQVGTIFSIIHGCAAVWGAGCAVRALCGEPVGEEGRRAAGRVQGGVRQ